MKAQHIEPRLSNVEEN
ncbi:Protein of unknown function [Bacillus mycoides]|nr:Protein of unknown function [Bacillus mycoides]